MKHTVIIGGGAIGLFAAYFLRKSGHEVTLADKGNVPGLHSCSSGNAGLIVPSHFMPIANRAAVREGLANLFKPAAPFGIKWSFNPELFGWLWSFYLSSRNRNMGDKVQFLADFHLKSRELYRAIQEDEGLNLTLSLSGLHMVSEKAETFRNDVKAAGDAANLGIPAEIWTAEKYRDQNPALDPRIAGAVFYPWDGNIDPLPMLNHIKHWLLDNGVTIMENTPVREWIKGQSGFEGIRLADKLVKADNYLVCAGDQSSEVLQGTGLSVPLQPAKGFSYLVRNAGESLSHPALLQDRHVAITPYKTHTRIAGNFLLGMNRIEDPGPRISRIGSSVSEVFPGWDLPSPKPEQVWSGNRPVSPDGLPLIGISSVFPNLAIATGHAMMGISLAPVTGSLVADWLSGRDTNRGWRNILLPSRFGNRF